MGFYKLGVDYSQWATPIVVMPKAWFQGSQDLWWFQCHSKPSTGNQPVAITKTWGLDLMEWTVYQVGFSEAYLQLELCRWI